MVSKTALPRSIKFLMQSSIIPRLTLYKYRYVQPCVYASTRKFSSIKSDVPYESSLHKSDKVKSESYKDFPTSADVVVIGGGSVGCSTAYHLAKYNAGKVVLIEKDLLTAGTTWHTAGLLWRLNANDVTTELIGHTADLMTKILPEETDQDTGWIQTGGLFTASNKERLDQFKRMHTMAKVYGIESYMLSPDETLKIYPMLNVSDICGSIYSPTDGTMDPAGTCVTYTRAAAKYGAQIFEKCEVNGITVKEDDFGVKRIHGIDTNKGYISTKNIVNCTGVWAPYLGEMAGVDVPQVAFKHAYVVTEHIDGVINCPNLRDHDASVYLKRQGDTLQVGGYEDNPIYLDRVDKNFAFGLYDLDWDVFGQHIEASCHRVPVIEKTGIRSTVCGPESFTPDGHPILGEAPEVRGFYHGSAFNSGGMMYGGGCGEQLAHWVIDGKPKLDMFHFDIRRFPNNLVDKKTWLKERSHEFYSKHYSIIFPHDQPLAGRNQRKDALHKELLDQGSFYEERHGWERPAYYMPPNQQVDVKEYDYYGYYGYSEHSNYTYKNQLEKDYTFDFPNDVHDIIGAECLTCRTNAAIFDISYFGKLFLSGPDVDKLAQKLFTRNVTNPDKIGKCIYTLMLNDDGGIEADLIVAPMKTENGEPMYFMSVGGATTEYCKGHVHKVIQDERLNCTVIDKTDDMGIISLQGPQSREILMSISKDPTLIKKLKFSSWAEVNINGCSVRVMRLSFVGELGYELHCANEHMVTVSKTLDAAVENKGVCKAGFRAMDSLSSEIGFHHWPHTIRPDDNAFEANLDNLCDFNEPNNFIGKESLLKQKGKPLQKQLVTFTIDEKVPFFGSEGIWRNNEIVGYIRSSAYCFAMKKNIAYGYLKPGKRGVLNEEYISSGDFAIERMGIKHPAIAHTKSPFDPTFRRILGKYSESQQNELFKDLDQIKKHLN